MGWLENALKIGGVVGAPFTGGASLALTGLGSTLGGAAKGAADERGGQNQFTDNNNRTLASMYGTEQGALLQKLLAQGQEATSRYGTRQGATTGAMQGLQGATSSALANQSAEGLQRSQLGLQSARERARQSVMGSVMQNLQPSSVQVAPGQRGHETKLSGGLSAANLDPMTRQHGGELMKAALQAQLSGSDVPAATDFKSGIQDWKSTVLDAPEATDYSNAIIAKPKLGEYEDAGKLESWLSLLGMGLSGAGAVAGGIATRGK
jgi:hypothetical protein